MMRIDDVVRVCRELLAERRRLRAVRRLRLVDPDPERERARAVADALSQWGGAPVRHTPLLPVGHMAVVLRPGGALELVFHDAREAERFFAALGGPPAPPRKPA